MSETIDQQIDELREKLQPFLIRNPETDLDIRRGQPAVTHPWGDDSVELIVEPEDGATIDALNAVRMPPRLTALWHNDSSELEVIFTAFPADQDLQSREFEFRFQDAEYRCEFSSASDRLLAIARASRPSGPSRTDQRNLRSLYVYMRSQEEGSAIGRNADPTSFWIRGIAEYDDALVTELVRNLNFYMSYFDRESPLVIVHEAPAEGVGYLVPARYRTGEFPRTMTGRTLDQHLLGLWERCECW